MPNTFVVAMGIGTVFFGLICIIILSCLMSAVCTKLGKKEPAAPAAAPAVPAAPAANAIPNRQAMIGRHFCRRGGGHGHRSRRNPHSVC